MQNKRIQESFKSELNSTNKVLVISGFFISLISTFLLFFTLNKFFG